MQIEIEVEIEVEVYQAVDSVFSLPLSDESEQATASRMLAAFCRIS
jgi:hypothetical protein